MAEMHERRRAALDILRIEHRKIATVLPRAPDHREQPAVALGGILAALDEDGLGDGVAGRQQVITQPLTLAVGMHDAGIRAEHRQIRIGAGVPAVIGL